MGRHCSQGASAVTSAGALVGRMYAITLLGGGLAPAGTGSIGRGFAGEGWLK